MLLKELSDRKGSNKQMNESDVQGEIHAKYIQVMCYVTQMPLYSN